MHKQTNPYDRLASSYDLLGDIYTGGGIRRAKLMHIKELKAGERVLYAGGGTGSECLLAATVGADVTIVDRSLPMLNRCRRRFEAADEDARFIHGDVFSSLQERTFDVVVAPFFLNTLPKTFLPEAIGLLTSYLQSGGRFVCVDFRAPSATSAFRLLQQAFYLPPLTLFWSLTQNPWHELYDYVSVTESAVLKLRLQSRVASNVWGAPLLETITWRVY